MNLTKKWIILLTLNSWTWHLELFIFEFHFGIFRSIIYYLIINNKIILKGRNRILRFYFFFCDFCKFFSCHNYLWYDMPYIRMIVIVVVFRSTIVELLEFLWWFWLSIRLLIFCIFLCKLIFLQYLLIFLYFFPPPPPPPPLLSRAIRISIGDITKWNFISNLYA